MNKKVLAALTGLLLSGSMSAFRVNAEDIPNIRGDINSDGRYDAADVLTVKGWLLGITDTDYKTILKADFNEDGIVNIFDFRHIKTGLLKEDFPQVLPVTPEPVTSKQIEVKNILQNPELPTGCEVVSLTILLNHLGYNADKLTMARKFLPKMKFYSSGGVQYGADFHTTFAGDPEDSSSYGCYAPCIKTTADIYFAVNRIKAEAQDLTGTDLETLLSDYIDNDRPVLIWITMGNLLASYPGSVWNTPDGRRVQWLANEHCVVLTGYDKGKGLIYVSDPLYGNKSYDLGKLKLRYNELGSQAVCINQK